MIYSYLLVISSEDHLIKFFHPFNLIHSIYFFKNFLNQPTLFLVLLITMKKIIYSRKESNQV
jgi:hypothetical protein